MTQHRVRVLEVLALSACCALCACRFERDPQSPFAADAGLSGDDAPEESSARGGADLTAGTSGSASGASAAAPGAGASGGIAGTGVTGGTAGADATGSGNAGAGAGAAGAAGTAGSAIEDDPTTSPDAGGAACTPADVVECDPVTNTGCPAGMQCAVDALSSVLAGYCIFSAPMDAGFCFNSGVTESCPPKHTCVVDTCRTLCFCDTDCEEGECCVEPVGTLGFKVCGAC